MQRRYQDAMAAVRAYGKPDVFVTFTCNPAWPEVQRALGPGQKPEDRPDLVARVFRIKLRALMLDITHFGVLGRRLRPSSATFQYRLSLHGAPRLRRGQGQRAMREASQRKRGLALL